MNYEIITNKQYLRAILSNRQTVEETRDFLRAVTEENKTHRHAHILFDVRKSRPIFHVEQHGLFEHCRRLFTGPACKIALVGDTKELRMSHDYIALLAQQQGLNIRSFRDDAAALRWLQDQRQSKDRRRQQDRRRASQLRRNGTRRSGTDNQASA